MGALRRPVGALAVWVMVFSLSMAPVATTAVVDRSDLDLVGVFTGETPITGAVMRDGHLFVTSTFKLSIFDLRAPLSPALVGTAVSRNPIHGELLPTNGELLLLNDFAHGRTLDVWNVEDRSNPVLLATIPDLPDEHWSCLSDCRWAYGSAGAVVDLRNAAEPKKARVNWRERVGLHPDITVHRIDEYRRGYLVTGPRDDAPAVIDARNPLRPRLAARTRLPLGRSPGIIYSSWPLAGRARYLLSAVEYPSSGGCSGRGGGTLLSFDTKGYPNRSRFPLAGRLSASASGCDGAGYYFDPSPSFRENALLAFAFLRGVMIVRLDERGRMTETASFSPPVGVIWHTFWAADNIVYALNRTGEIYILRYS